MTDMKEYGKVRLRNERPIRDAAVAKFLERLIAANPDFGSTDGYLLYAPSLEKLGEIQPI